MLRFDYPVEIYKDTHKDRISLNCLERKDPGIGNENYKTRLCKRVWGELPSFSLIPRGKKCTCLLDFRK